MTFCILVARYNENIEWTRQFKNVIIYNKGDALTENFNQVFLNNVGREGHSYYKYIYDNYNNLEDYTIFLQGHPFDHSPNLIDNLNKYLNNNDLNIDFEYLSEAILDCNLSGCRYHEGLPLRDTYEKLFNIRKEYMDFKFGTGAQFIVSKKYILKRSQTFYYKIIEILQNDVHPTEGYAIERFHKIIFE